MLHVTNGHLDYLGLLDPAPALLQIIRWNQSAEVGQAVVHAISPALLYDPVRHRILLKQRKAIEAVITHVSLTPRASAIYKRVFYQHERHMTSFLSTRAARECIGYYSHTYHGLNIILRGNSWGY